MAEINQEQNSLYGVIIKVENLDVCRAFYRDVIELGPPISDSNFWVEFELQERVSLVLEQIAKGEKLPPSRSRISWLYNLAEAPRIMAKLKEHGFEPIEEERDRLGFAVYMYLDPEGNPFFIMARPDEEPKK